MGSSLLDWLLPPSCPGCGRSGSPGFCRGCRGRLVRPPVLPLDRALVVGAALYEGPMREAILGLKRGGLVSHVEALSAGMAAALRDAPEAAWPDLLVAVPADPGRRRARGIHPPALLAAAVARRLGLPAAPDMLRARGGLPSQQGLSRAQRETNLAGRFLASARVRGRRILVVDDVVTTGGTLREAIRALQASGGRVVSALAAGVGEMFTSEARGALASGPELE